MSSPNPTRRRTARGLAVMAGSVLVGIAGLATAPSTSAAPDGGDGARPQRLEGTPAAYDAGRYVVVLKAPPAVSYDGGTRGLAPTRPGPGREFRGDSTAVRAYSTYLRGEQRALARSVGAAPDAQYTAALNGFSADLTGEQATELATSRDVLLLSKDTLRKVDTWNTPTFLGLEGTDGAWAKNGGEASAGDGVVVGVIDSGIWPSNRSFRGDALTATPSTTWDISMDAEGNTRMEKVDGGVFRGYCEEGEAFPRAFCTTKLISARTFGEGYFDSVPADSLPDSEYVSPRDGSGHGSHTASTAAGRAVKNVSVEGRAFGTIKGMAPAAKIAVYKTCWENVDPDLTGCYTSDNVAAIDQAVVDGVDVINFSISGAQDTVIDPVELAFEGAAEAGIFIAASAGNSGPDASTVAHNSPWLTTVAAGTHASFENTLVLGDGTKILGSSINGTFLSQRPVVTAEASVVSGGDAADARLCGPETLDPAKVTGKIVVCYRGTYDRVAKSAEVKRAGGRAMILVNPSPNSLDADFHAVPTIHISDTDGATLATYLESTPNPTAAFRLKNLTGQTTPLPQVAGFSSRGPALANDGMLLKPDITAPGQSVLAAVAPPSNQGRDYDLYSGTSMSSPHIAGLAAFMLGRKPSWAPMDVKSAMMTTATPLKRADGSVDTNALAGGSGEVTPRDFFSPGLFISSDARDWSAFLAGQGLDTGSRPLAAGDLNVPSIANDAVTGSYTVTRSLRASTAGTWRIRTYQPGFDVSVSPASVVSKRAGDVIDLTLTYTRTTAPLGDYSSGAITLTGPSKVRIPVQLRPVVVDAPAKVTGTTAEGEAELSLVGGTDTDLAITTSGLAAAQGYDDAIPAGEQFLDCFSVTPGTTTRAVFDLDARDNSADLDLVVYAADDCATDAITGVAGESATGSPDERVVVDEPDSPVYITQSIGFSAGTQGSPIPFTLAVFDLGGTPDLGDLTVTPNPVAITQGSTSTATVSWTGLTPGRYLGYLAYEGSVEETEVAVTVPES
ncbi:S8 family serine peptidase [Nocardioides sp.]|uniref:S8 family serine peptidase n=1 Tax=Nocardioides sp. TaxID=35761 RepID=UPI00351608E3